MARLVFAPSAITDTHDVLTTLIDKAGQSVAVAYWDRFQATFRRIAAFPMSGAARPRLGTTVRIAVVRPYVDHLSGKCECS
jgi:plasmid stabilization system protein ParE